MPDYPVSSSGDEPACHPQLIGLDWGTTSCRAYLIGEGGRILDSNTGGIGVLALSARAPDKSAAFDGQLKVLVGEWLGTSPGLPLLSCGMVGSDQGWALASYKETPADLMNNSLLPLTEVSTSCGPLHIVPGLLTKGTSDGYGAGLPNVMRGEETQILGILPDTVRDDSIVILPGTHTKWARLKGSTVTDFATSMTGEIYALLLQHSILGRSLKAPAVHDGTAFQRGLDVVFGNRTGSTTVNTDILSTLFSARTLAMTGQLKPTEVPDYISGLMIGTEVAGFAHRWLNGGTSAPAERPTVTICATETLASRYASALLRLNINATLATEHAAAKGLWLAAVQAGLIKKEST